MMGAMSELLSEQRIAYPFYPHPRNGASTSGTHPSDDGEGDVGDEEYDNRDIYLFFFVVIFGHDVSM